MSLPVGEPAPDFALTDQHGRTVRLADLRGKKAALVVFFPWAFSGICGGELQELQAHLDELESDRVALFAVSTDSMYALRTYADREGFTFPLLSDSWPHAAVARAYDVLDPGTGVALRATFLVDLAGTVRWSIVNGIGQARDVGEYLTALAAMGPGGRG